MTKQYQSYPAKLRLLERHLFSGDLSRNERLTRLATQLGAQLHPQRNYTKQALYRVFAGRQPGRFLAVAIDRLYAKLKPRQRRDKLRVYVPVKDEDERQRINQLLSAEDKRAALLMAAYFEED